MTWSTGNGGYNVEKRRNHWTARGVGAGLAALLLTAQVPPSLGQPLPVPRPSLADDTATPATDPIAELLDRVGREERPNSTIPVVIGLRLQEEADRSRFVVELSDPVQAEVFTLTNPNRVVIDLPEVLWRHADTARPSGRAAIKSYRYGLFRQGNSRFVIDLNRPVQAATPRILPPEGGLGFRLLIDLHPTSQQAFLASAGWPEDDTASTPIAPPMPAIPPIAGTRGKRVVVIDAGHGGIDPGSHGANGLREKDVVLAVARKVREQLETTGRYRVQLTRDRDVFVPLRERVNIARAAKSELLVSLHADSHEQRDVRGASVYTLSEGASDREAAKLAEKENMSDVIAGVNLSEENAPVASILIDLAQRDTMNRSTRFAKTLLSLLPGATPVRPTSPHRSAGFAVLKAPDVPAALLELGYLTNAQDARDMGTEAWRSQVARAISRAIDTHFAAESASQARQTATR